MKKVFILIGFVFLTGICSNINAQQAAPAGAGDKDLRDTNIRTRSIDLERVDRDSRKKSESSDKKADAKKEDRLAAKYAEIKSDYEQIQLSQDNIIKTYQGTGKIDYALISKAAQEMNTAAMRLNSNLFPISTDKKTDGKDEKKEEKTEKETKQTKSVRDVIVDLDNTIGSFAASPMFQNLRVVDATVSAKAKLDLEKIIELSALLNAESQKSITGEK